jgi:hypothetical protein
MKKTTTLLLLGAGLVAGGALNASITTGVELITAPLDDPGLGSFGSGFTNYRAMDSSVWHEKYGSGDATNDTANGREVLQDEANSTVPSAAEGEYWAGFAPDDGNGFTDPAIYYSLGTWETGNATSFDLGFDLGERSNVGFGSFEIQLVYTDSGFAAADGTDLATAAGYTIADTTATYTASTSGWATVSGGRVLTGLTDTLDITGISNSQELWVVLTASGDATQSFVDNLSVTAVPEPSTYALIGGFLALGLVMLRRRLRD